MAEERGIEPRPDFSRPCLANKCDKPIFAFLPYKNTEWNACASRRAAKNLSLDILIEAFEFSMLFMAEGEGLEPP
jgi:hypothetical protein